MAATLRRLRASAEYSRGADASEMRHQCTVYLPPSFLWLSWFDGPDIVNHSALDAQNQLCHLLCLFCLPRLSGTTTFLINIDAGKLTKFSDMTRIFV